MVWVSICCWWYVVVGDQLCVNARRAPARPNRGEVDYESGNNYLRKCRVILWKVPGEFLSSWKFPDFASFA